MRKYRIIKETNLNSGEVTYEIQKRKYLFFWAKAETYYEDLQAAYDKFLKLTHRTKPKFKREEVAIDNIYV